MFVWTVWMTAWAWPTDAGWLPVVAAGFAVTDPIDGPGPERDLLGDATGEAVAWSADADHFYLRLRVAGPGSVSAGYGFILDSDANGAAEAVVFAGVDELQLHPNATGVAGTEPGFGHYGPATQLGARADRVRLTEAGGQFWVDLEVPRTALEPDGVRLVGVTGTTIYQPWSDVAGCPGSAAFGCPSLLGLVSDRLVFDTDGDGWTDPVEVEVGADPNSLDSDGDGMPDAVEQVSDTDGDGLADIVDPDSDDDGLTDGAEWNGPTDPFVADTDGGGLADGLEDRDGDGTVGPWETDPVDPTDDLDTDGDGIADVLELLGADASVDDGDSDGDGVADLEEGLEDPDGDGLPSFLDDDSNGDGLLDAAVGAGDLDGDGVGNTLDDDVDGDGMSNVVEGSIDSDGDGLIDALDTDSDADGLPDVLEGAGDADGDGIRNALDADSDGDGLLDSVEGPADTNADGVLDSQSLDADGDGIPDAEEGAEDPDLDGIPNFQDRNSDGRGSSDADEGTGDVDCDGLPDFRDRDDEDGFCGPAQDLPEVGPGVIPPEWSDDSGCATAAVRVNWTWWRRR